MEEGEVLMLITVVAVSVSSSVVTARLDAFFLVVFTLTVVFSRLDLAVVIVKIVFCHSSEVSTGKVREERQGVHSRSGTTFVSPRSCCDRSLPLGVGAHDRAPDARLRRQRAHESRRRWECQFEKLFVR